jgi:alpha-N-arabinofuranosidase
VATRRPRTFRNPILPGFYPDPSLCRVGRDFYLVTSSFEYFPGVPIFHSRDLVHWQQLGHVLARRSQLELTGVASSGGIYAPTLRYSRGRFFLVTTHVGGGGNFLVTASRPEGPWSDPVWIDEGGFDPSLFFDRGRVYYARNGKGADFDHPVIEQAELDLNTGRLKGSMRVIWHGTGNVWTEGAHLYALHGRTYLLAAEGGTAYGHCEVAARGDSPFGPFAPCPRNPVLSHRHRRSHPIQATGHADLVTLDDGSVWAVFLGVRPRPGRHHHLGRETFLAPVHFSDDGWPTIGEGGQVELEMAAPELRPHLFAPVPARDDFENVVLDPVWVHVRNPPDGAVRLGERAGHLRLWGQPASLDEVGPVAFVGRRQQHFVLCCKAQLDFSPQQAGEEAGLSVRAREDFHLDVAVRRGGSGREVVALRRTGGVARVLGRGPVAPGPVELCIRAEADRYQLLAGTGRARVLLGQVPARALSAETITRRGPMHFCGVAIGMYATGRGRPCSVPADFDWFDYRPSAGG